MKAKAKNLVCTAFLISICLFSLFSLDWFRRAGAQNVTRSAKIATFDTASSSTSLFEKSSHVVVGNVLSIESRWDEKAATICTYVKVHVEERLKGELAEDCVVIKHRGGEIGNIGLLISNESHFLLGERVKVFLKRDETGCFSVVGRIDVKSSLTLSPSSGYNYSGCTGLIMTYQYSITLMGMALRILRAPQANSTLLGQVFKHGRMTLAHPWITLTWEQQHGVTNGMVTTWSLGVQ